MERAAANLAGLYDPHDGKQFTEDSSKWNDDYMNKLMVEVVLNFSHERVDHLKDVVHYLRPVPKKVPALAHEDNPRYEYNNSPDANYQEENAVPRQMGITVELRLQLVLLSVLLLVALLHLSQVLLSLAALLPVLLLVVSQLLLSLMEVNNL